MRIVRYILFLPFIAGVVATVTAQSPSFLRLDRQRHVLDRMELLYMSDTFYHAGYQRYDRKEWVSRLKVVREEAPFSSLDAADIRHLIADQPECTADSLVPQHASPWLGVFYPVNSAFIFVDQSSFQLVANPVLHFSYDKGFQQEEILFQNTRGVDFRAYVDKRVYAHARILENQRSFPQYANQRIIDHLAIPGQGSWQVYQSSVSDRLRGYDYLSATGYLGFAATPHIHLEFGHGNHFFGHGIRSLLLSDHAHNYLYLRLDTRMWRFRYQNLFAELASASATANPLERLLPRKYMATHYLSYTPNSRWELGLFESVIFSRDRGFELQYLNPIILYRAVEQWIDSPDNALLGLNVRFNPKRGLGFYSQLVLDEFRLSELRESTGWWANKLGWQAGVKVYNAFGVDHLDVQFELNTVRPYTYSHWDTLPELPQYAKASYTHYNQPLAHPLGANFREWLLQVRYAPRDRWTINARALHAFYGEDPPGENWGGNILLNNGSKVQLYNNRIGQGKTVNVSSLFMEISYEMAHNIYFDIRGLLRRRMADSSSWQNFIGAGFRVNAFNQHYDY